MDSESKYPEVLSDLAAKTAALLSEAGMDRKKAADLAWRVAEAIRKDWAGQQIYIGKGLNYELDSRDLEIWNKFTGNNHAELAREYRLTERQIYNVINRVREVEFRKRQMGLF